MSYIHIDERLDVLASLELCAISLTHTRQTERAWKWVILSLHSALQGAMVCHLSGAAQLGALTTQSASKWLDWYNNKRHSETESMQEDYDEFGVPNTQAEDNGEPAPVEVVASATVLFERLYCRSKRIEESFGEVIPVTEQQKKSFKRLHRLRNEVTHFSPKGWSIELSYIWEIIPDVLAVLGLILDDPWTFIHMSDEDRIALHSKFKEINQLILTGCEPP